MDVGTGRPQIDARGPVKYNGSPSFALKVEYHRLCTMLDARGVQSDPVALRSKSGQRRWCSMGQSAWRCAGAYPIL